MRSLQVCFVFSILTIGSLNALPIGEDNDDLRETIKLLQVRNDKGNLANIQLHLVITHFI